MTANPARVLLWSPRILGLLVSLFFVMFALDAFAPAAPAPEALTDFMIHLTPALVVLVLVVVSFRRPWIGGAGFVGLALVYAAAMSPARLDWVLLISGPLAIVGLLFLWSWRYQRRTQVS